MRIIFINDNDELFFSTNVNQKVSDDFIDLQFIKGSKKWILKELGATEIPNPDPNFQPEV